MSGAVRDPGPELSGKELGAHVADHLPRPQSWPEEVGGEDGEGAQACASSSWEAPNMALTTTLLHPQPHVARLIPFPGSASAAVQQLLALVCPPHKPPLWLHSTFHSFMELILHA